MLLTDVKKAIHLLYVPTMFCNMGCKYCYLGNLTDVKKDEERALKTLEYAVKKLLDNGYLPFNISLHGGEPTTISPSVLEDLFAFITRYYDEYEEKLNSLGFGKKPVHIKTNMFNFDKLNDLFKKYEVSISGSIDLPLHLHKKYRVDKAGKSTLNKILSNLKLLAKYPYKKKISCVLMKEHLDYIDDLINDIWYIHKEIGFDMTNFNIMFGFESIENFNKFKAKYSNMMSDEEMVYVYNKLKQAFTNTELEFGFKRYWFEEFTPSFCCSSINCGDKFFLLQSNGNVFSCPRGQSNKKFFYGNIFKDDINLIVNKGASIIEKIENTLDISNECLECNYFKYCNMGCTFVRNELNLRKSYTCALQKQIYQDNPDLYPPMNKEEKEFYITSFLRRNNLKKINFTPRDDNFNITQELWDDKNSLINIIKSDVVLEKMFKDDLFILEINGNKSNLKSQVLSKEHLTEVIFRDDDIKLFIKKDTFNINRGKDMNSLMIICLNDEKIIYGDEKRVKQKHIWDYVLYEDILREYFDYNGEYYCLDLGKILRDNEVFFKQGIKNNIFFTTKKIREYHYDKQKNNAFYHIQAINLPFHHFEFFYVKENTK